MSRIIFSHYQTFDGISYNMKVDQDCSYILARSSGNQEISFEVVLESERCQLVIKNKLQKSF